MPAGKIIGYGLLALIAVLQISSACTTRSVDCPGYDSIRLRQWFPYRTGDIRIFTNSAAQTETVSINNVQTSQPYSFKTSTSGSVCNTSAQISGERVNDHASFSIMDQRDDLGSGTISFTFGSFNLWAISLSDTGFLSPQQCTTTTHTNFTLGTNTYGKVQEITANAGGTISKVYIAPGSGMVGYETSLGHTTWWLR